MATRRRRYVIGNFCSIVSTSDIFGIEFKQRMDELNHMMNERKFDDDLKQRCRMYYIESKETKRVRNYRKLEQEMSIHMRGEVACANNKSWLMKIWCVIIVVIVVPLPARRSRRARRGTARAVTNTHTASRRRLAIDDDVRPACCGCVSRCARDCDAWRRRYLVDASDNFVVEISQLLVPMVFAPVRHGRGLIPLVVAVVIIVVVVVVVVVVARAGAGPRCARRANLSNRGCRVRARARAPHPAGWVALA